MCVHILAISLHPDVINRVGGITEAEENLRAEDENYNCFLRDDDILVASAITSN